MIVRTRALHESDKLERRAEILDAAEGLFLARRDGLASMEQLAQAAGVAKGTLYLYFPSKEEVLLALHARNAHAFFTDLEARLGSEPPVSFEELFALTQRHMIERPSYLPLATLVLGLLEQSVPLEAATSFRAQMHARLANGGSALERAVGLPAGEGAQFLHRAYALIVGLWQLNSCGCLRELDTTAGSAERDAFLIDYTADLERALRALWSGTITPAAAARNMRRPPNRNRSRK